MVNRWTMQVPGPYAYVEFLFPLEEFEKSGVHCTFLTFRSKLRTGNLIQSQLNRSDAHVNSL